MKIQRVEFDETTCCAMREAFGANELAHLKNAIGDQKFKILAGIFNNTHRMGGFMGSSEALFYYKVAEVELERLNLLTQTAALPCGHKACEHTWALEGLRNQIIQPQKLN
jgi:hypothetical protein